MGANIVETGVCTWLQPIVANRLNTLAFWAMHASIPFNDEKPREFNMIELSGWSEVHSPFVEFIKT